jgi:ribosomal protein S18 acetylase RimI-like enzyme
VSQAFVRTAAKSDVPCVCRLQQQWLEEDNTYGFEPDSSEQVKAALGSYFLVAEAKSEIIGFIFGSIYTSDGLAVIPAGESYLVIDNLYVLPEFRRQGIGGKLVAQLLTQARQQNVAYALLYSAAKDIQSILRFYGQHNFQSWNVQMFQKL